MWRTRWARSLTPCARWGWGKRRRSSWRTERGCQAARALGATAMLQIPGFVQIMWDPKSPVIPYDAAWEKSLAIYRALAPVGERHGVTLCVENVWNRFLLSPLEMRQFVDAIGTPSV